MKEQMRPSDIFYTQYSILEYFKNGHSIQTTTEDIENGKVNIDDFPLIRVFYDHEKCHRWMSLDNRRLWVFKQLELARFLEKVSVETVQPEPSELKRKFTTTSCGSSINIRKRKPLMPCIPDIPLGVGNYEDIMVIYEYEAEELDGYDSENEEVIPASKTYRQSCKSRTAMCRKNDKPKVGV